MGKTSVRLPPELSKKLQSEARRLGLVSGETVTVSELIRGCIVEKFSRSPGGGAGKNIDLVELKDEIFQLKERHMLLAEDVQKLVRALTVQFERVATREQIDSLTDGIGQVVRTLRGE